MGRTGPIGRVRGSRMQLGDAVFVADERYVRPRHGFITDFTITRDSTGFEDIKYRVEFNDTSTWEEARLCVDTLGVYGPDLIFYDCGSAISKLNTLHIMRRKDDK